MTQTLHEWLMGRDEIASRSYDFIAERPFWEMPWFRIGCAAVSICLVWFFWPGLR